MAFTFGDSFDLYAATTDAVAGYWDSGASANWVIGTPGRFSGSQAFRSSTGTTFLTKASGSNDAVHHINFAYKNTSISTSTGAMSGFTLLDGTTAQCTIDFRQDGALELRSGSVTGSVLATWPTACPATGVWFSYEVELVIHNTAGSITVRRNGNTSADFSATSLNTRGSSNNYANKLSIVGGTNAGNTEWIDDILWRSDASAVSWAGDLRCWTRMPASDASVQFSKSPTSINQAITGGSASSVARTAGTVSYQPFVATYSGTIASATVNINTGGTGNIKCAIYASSGGSPTTVLATSNAVVNPTAINQTITFASPPTVVKGQTYFFAIDQDISITYWDYVAVTGAWTGSTAYASFPAANPAGLATQTAQPQVVVIITPTVTAEFVAEAQEDGTTSYVYDSTVGHGDLYAISSLSGISTVSSVTAVTTRGFAEKSDAGARGAAMQLKSGATTVQSTATLLSTSFAWLYRTDTTDPNTSSAWTAGNVDSVQIGPTVTS